MVGLLASIPILIQPFAAPIGGILADKYSRKVILFITRLIEASGFILLAISINLDISPLILIYNLVWDYQYSKFYTKSL